MSNPITFLPDANTRQLAYEELRRGILSTLPEFWPPIEIGLAVMSTVLISTNSQPTAVIFEGPSGTGKTSVAYILDSHPMTYRSDNFTEKSWITGFHDKGDSKDDPNRHLINRVRYKTLITPEMGRLFSGKEDEVQGRLAAATQVLDGHGLSQDLGTIGQVRHTGDYMLSWIGCTTPLNQAAWKAMDKLGNRFLFWEFEEKEESLDDQMEAYIHGQAFHTRREECKALVSHYLPTLFGPSEISSKSRVRKLVWNPAGDSREVGNWFFMLARLASVGRGTDPRRFTEVFKNLAQTLSFNRGSDQLSPEIVPALAHLALSSIPMKDRKVILALIRGNGKATLTEVAEVAKRAKSTVSDWNLRTTPIYERGSGFTLRDDWEWLLQLQSILGGPFDGLEPFDPDAEGGA